MTQERIHKRLVGLARFWQRRFGLDYDQLDDLVQEAWLFWLERGSSETEKGFNQINSCLRRSIIKKIWGYCPHGSKIPGPPPVYRDVSYITDSYEESFDSRVIMRNILESCWESDNPVAVTNTTKPTSHFETIAILTGAKSLDTMNKNTVLGKIFRLRNFITEKNLI